jgi:hypothetical protein
MAFSHKGKIKMRNLSNVVTRRSGTVTTRDEPRNSEATGKDPRAMSGEAPDGKTGTEADVAKQELPDHGNVEHSLDVAMTTDAIKKWRPNQ